MKNYLLLMSLSLICFSADVGKATNASQTNKMLVISDDHPVTVQILAELASADLIIVQVGYFDTNIESTMKIINPPVFLVPDPVKAEPDLFTGYLNYKQKGQLKAKFHPRYLFNPVKRC